MRAALVSVFLLVGLAASAASATAQAPAPGPATAPAVATGAADSASATDSADSGDHGRINSVTVDPAHIPPTELRTPVIDPERGSRKPSGYWTGYRPAQGDSYKWPLVIIALIVTAITSSILIVTLRRVSRQRPARPGLRPA